VTPSEAASAVRPKPSPEDLAGQADTGPKPVRVEGGSGAAGGIGGNTTIHAPVTINAGHQTPAELAGSMQRHVAQARSWRAHDMEPELT
jgi:hypothetical protein